MELKPSNYYTEGDKAPMFTTGHVYSFLITVEDVTLLYQASEISLNGLTASGITISLTNSNANIVSANVSYDLVKTPGRIHGKSQTATKTELMMGVRDESFYTAFYSIIFSFDQKHLDWIYDLTLPYDLSLTLHYNLSPWPSTQRKPFELCNKTMRPLYQTQGHWTLSHLLRCAALQSLI